MIEASHWHPVALAESVTDHPVAVTLLDQAVVLWRGEVGIVHAWADQCPHRGARFSLGKVIGGKLECGYHGWQFAASGQCVFVPAMPAFTAPATHCARRFQAREAYGLIWVCIGGPNAGSSNTGSVFELPSFAAESDAALYKLNCGPYDVATSAPRVVENFLDMAHFGFVHEGWLGSRPTATSTASTTISDYLVEPTATGLVATNCKAWQPRSNVHSTAPAQVEYRYEVTAPYCALLTKVPDPASVALANFRESIGLFVCPLTSESSRVWFRLAVAHTELNRASDDKLRDFQHTIFMQDKPILESQQPKRLPLDLQAERHTAADKASSAYRRHLAGMGITFGVC